MVGIQLVEVIIIVLMAALLGDLMTVLWKHAGLGLILRTQETPVSTYYLGVCVQATQPFCALVSTSAKRRSPRETLYKLHGIVHVKVSTW